MAGQVIQCADSGIRTGDNGDHVGMGREHRPQFLVRTVFLEGTAAVHGVKLPIRLHDAEVEITFTDAVEIGDRTAGCRGGAAEIMVGAVAIDQLADRLPDDIVNAGLSSRADRDELFGSR